MGYVGFYAVAMIIIGMTYWIYKWRNPTCNGRLPPGSLGFPLIGETIQFFIPTNSLDVPPFIKHRIQKYGQVFKTSLVGRPVIVSCDANFNNFILQQEGKLVELWYMDSFAKILGQSGSVGGYIHKQLKKLVSEHFGHQNLKEKLLPRMEHMANQAIHSWAGQESVELKHASSMMILDLTSRELISYNPEKSKENMSEMFTNFIEGLMSVPLNMPGTAFHRCLQKQKKILKMIKDRIEERREASDQTKIGDFLDHFKNEMKTEEFLTDDFITYMMFALLFATSETIPSTLTLAIKLLTENPSVLQELVKEHEETLQNRENMETGLTWKEYKSMTFTMQVINETLRMGSAAAGILRRAKKDIHMNGYTIPEGWTIMVIPSALHLNPDTYKDPLAFNPWRWKTDTYCKNAEELGGNVRAKYFIPFGGGMRSCVGAEFSKVLMAVFIHVLVTKYRWSNVKGGEIVRSPILGFGNGYHIKVSQKHK